MKKQRSEGLWAKIAEAEVSAEKIISAQIKGWGDIVVRCLELGTEVTTLKGRSEAGQDIVVSGLFLNKTLKDMRATWKLVQMGYTSQAASVAASLFENGLLCRITAGNTDLAEKALSSIKNPEKEIPWGVMEMCRLSALTEKKSLEGDELRLRTVSDYAAYKWLCKIKHPTLISAMHDASSTRIDSKGYVVIPLPDVRPEDIGNKIMIIEISLIKLFFAIKHFVKAMKIEDLDAEKPEVKDWTEAMINLFDALNKKAKVSKPNLAFTLKGSGLYREFDKLMSEKYKGH